MRLDLLSSLSLALCLASVTSAPTSPGWDFSLKGAYLSQIKLTTQENIIPMAYHNQKILRVIPAGSRRLAKNAGDEKALGHFHRDDDYSLLQRFTVKPELIGQELFGPKKCPVHTFDISSNPCEFDSFSCNSSSSSSSSSSSCNSHTLDVGTHISASCPRQVGQYSYPGLENTCHFDKEDVVNVRVGGSGRSYILYKKSLVVIDCKCEKVKQLKHFYYNNQVFEGVDLLVNEDAGYLLLGLSGMYMVVYRLCDFNVIYENYFYSCFSKKVTYLQPQSPYVFANSALIIDNNSWNLYLITADSSWVLIRIPLPYAENPNSQDTYCPLFEILYESLDAICPFSSVNPAVVNDYMNHMDIMVNKVGNDLNFLIVEYDTMSSLVFSSCNSVALPNCVFGDLVSNNGIKLPYCNQLFFSLVPSLDMVTVNYHLNATKKK